MSIILHPHQTAYLEENAGSSRGSPKKSSISGMPNCPEKITECPNDKIIDETKRTLLYSIANFNDIYASKTPTTMACLKNLIIMVNLLIDKKCSMNFNKGEINNLLVNLAQIDLSYYNVLTVHVYTLIFGQLGDHLKGIVKENKTEYNKEMIKYASQVRIFFYDSYIFSTRYLINVTNGFGARYDLPPDIIYPYQMGEIGLGNDFISYFLYLHYLFNMIFLSISDVVSRGEATRLKSLLQIFPATMDYFVFIPENLDVANASISLNNQPAPGIYGKHNMTYKDARIIINMIIVFVTELQHIFFDMRKKPDDSCSTVSLYLCNSFGVGFSKCNEYLNLLRYEKSDNPRSFLNRIDRGFGNYRYTMLLDYNNDGDVPVNNLALRSDEFAEDRMSFIKNISGLRANNDFKINLCKTVNYLKVVGMYKTNRSRKCMETINDFVDIIKDGMEEKERCNQKYVDDKPKISPFAAAAISSPPTSPPLSPKASPPLSPKGIPIPSDNTAAAAAASTSPPDGWKKIEARPTSPGRSILATTRTDAVERTNTPPRAPSRYNMVVPSNQDAYSPSRSANSDPGTIWRPTRPITKPYIKPPAAAASAASAATDRSSSPGWRKAAITPSAAAASSTLNNNLETPNLSEQ